MTYATHRIRLVLAAIATAALTTGTGLATTAFPASAAPATVTGVTYLPDNGDNGNGVLIKAPNTVNVWAIDTFHRTLTVSTSSACSPAPVSPYACYSATVSDTGTFKSVPGNGNAPNPNSTTDPGTNIAFPPVSGPFSGSANYLFEANAAPDASHIPGYLDNGGVYQSGATNIKSTSGWFANAFAGATGFENSNGTPFTGAIQNDWTWTYTSRTGASSTTTAVNCETWTDSAANGSGDTALDGNVTGKQCAGTPVPVIYPSYTGAISNFHSAKCLSDSAAAPATGNVLVQETCDGSTAEQFVLTTGPDGQLNLEGTSLCVASNGRAAKPLRLVPCSSAVYELYRTTVAKHGPNYEYPGTGLVMDDSGASLASGATVIGYPQKAYASAANQHWSLP